MFLRLIPPSPSGAEILSAVVARGLYKRFGRGETSEVVLNCTHFDAHAGEMTFLVGPSGCGKTTLISILSAMLRADEGEVSVFGADLKTLSGRALSRFRGETVGFVFQQFNLLPALDAAENAAVPLIVHGMASGRARRRASELLDRLGLAESLKKFPRELSGGQQQRVAIARALVHDPKLIVCDEPTASLDGASGHAVMDVLRTLAVRPDRAAIVVTHDDRIFRFADRIAFMADGRVVRTENRPFEETH
ncbi:MAG: ABC transporter ATP-binding protein [Hyphomicrobiales bacterium]